MWRAKFTNADWSCTKVTHHQAQSEKFKSQQNTFWKIYLRKDKQRTKCYLLLVGGNAHNFQTNSAFIHYGNLAT